MIDSLEITDQFCGCGGSSDGAEQAGAEVKAAINHSELAIESHSANFPKTRHYCTDTRLADPRQFVRTLGLWSSPECTNHSVGKGKKRVSGQTSFVDEEEADPAAERSRATMWDVPRFAEVHDYRFIIVENVVDARKWRLWPAWVKAMQCLDYEFRVLYLNAQFFGVPQSRDRMFVVAWKKGMRQPDLEFRPRAYCVVCEKEVEAVQSWKKPHYPWGRYDNGNKRGQYHYRCPECTKVVYPYYSPALLAIDWSDPGTRIGDRAQEGKRPLKESTLRRIRTGLEKYGNQYLVLELGHTQATSKHVYPLTDPLPTQTTRQTQALALPFLTSTSYFDERARSSTEPLPTQTTGNKRAVTFPPSSVIVFRRDADAQSPGEPLTTITAGGINHGIAFPPSSLVVCRQNSDARGVDEPLPTLVASGPVTGIVRAPFLVVNYSPGYSKPVTDPLATVTCTDHHSVVQSEPLILSYYNRDSAIHPAGQPLGVITTAARHGLVRPDSVEVEDCWFRMLQPPEIGAGQGFRPDYIVLGNKRQMTWQYGNAVPPPMARWLVERVVPVL